MSSDRRAPLMIGFHIDLSQGISVPVVPRFLVPRPARAPALMFIRFRTLQNFFLPHTHTHRTATPRRKGEQGWSRGFGPRPSPQKYSKEVHRLLAVTPRKSLHPSKQNFARRLRRRLTPDSSQRHYETARKLVLCSRAIRTSTFLLGALRAPILHWNTPHFHIFFRFKGGTRNS